MISLDVAQNNLYQILKVNQNVKIITTDKAIIQPF